MIRDGILVDGSGGGDAPAPVLIEKSVTANGTYSASDDSADGYSSVGVSVPNTYAAGDEGKVVSNGALVAQTAVEKTVNGTYDTTTNNSVVVNVANSYVAADEGKVVSNGSLVAQGADSVTENGVVDTTLISSLTVTVSSGIEVRPQQSTQPSMSSVVKHLLYAFRKKTWTGSIFFDGEYIWTDGDNIYYSTGTNQYILDKSTSTWSAKIWNGFSEFDGTNIWTDGDNIYYSASTNHYVLTLRYGTEYVTEYTPSIPTTSCKVKFT